MPTVGSKSCTATNCCPSKPLTCQSQCLCRLMRKRSTRASMTSSKGAGAKNRVPPPRIRGAAIPSCPVHGLANWPAHEPHSRPANRTSLSCPNTGHFYFALTPTYRWCSSLTDPLLDVASTFVSARVPWDCIAFLIGRLPCEHICTEPFAA